LAFLIAATAGAEALTGTTTGEAAETLATDPGEVEAGEDHDDHDRIPDIHDEHVDEEDIEENRARKHDAPASGALHDEQEAGNNLKGLNDGEIAGAGQASEECCGEFDSLFTIWGRGRWQERLHSGHEVRDTEDN